MHCLGFLGRVSETFLFEQGILSLIFQVTLISIIQLIDILDPLISITSIGGVNNNGLNACFGRGVPVVKLIGLLVEVQHNAHQGETQLRIVGCLHEGQVEDLLHES